MYIRSLAEYEYGKSNKPEWQEFERLVRDCAAVEFGQDFHLFGRSGQKDYGIDVFSDDWKTVIQCKDYKDYGKLRGKIQEDFQEARSHFVNEDDGKPFIETYIVATTLETDGKTQELARDLSGNGIEVKVWFWNDICRIIDKYQIHNDGDKFVEGFMEPLFLHQGKSGCENVCLKNLFVPQEYREMDGNFHFGEPRDDLETRIRRFLHEDAQKLLIIEGDAGSGKSTLVAWLSHTAKEESYDVRSVAKNANIRAVESAPSLLGDRPLITVRLRDLTEQQIRENTLGRAILSHMHLGEKSVLEQTFPRAVFVLDGFDELCMMEGLRDYENMIYQFCGWVPEGCKILITTRPRYIQAGRIRNIPFSLLTLEHFGPKKRMEWLDRYIALFPADSQPVEPEVADYICSVSDKSTSNLCDTPLTLYLLVGSKATFDLTRNIWALYHHIFSRTVVETDYAKQMKPGNKAHPMGAGMGELLYQITEETAYKMFCAGGERRDDDIVQDGEGQFLVRDEGIDTIIQHLQEQPSFKEEAFFLNPETRKDTLKRCHALCCYLKTNADRGLIEFYHNNIRDFFLCEKLYRELNLIYQRNIPDPEKITRLAQRFVEIFQNGTLSPMVREFLFRRAERAVAEHKTDEFPLLERVHPLLPELYQHMLVHGTLYDGLGVENHVRAIESILHGTAQLYRSIYDPILEDGAHIHWWKDVDAVNRSGMIGYVFCRFVVEIGDRADLSGAVLSEANLSEANLSGVDLSGANLSNAILSSANLFGANLSGANLSGADLSKANMTGAVLSEAVLFGSNFSGADFTGADLSRADFTGANISGVDLFWIN